MPKFRAKLEPTNSSLYLTYLQDDTSIIISVSQITPSPIQSSQQNLLLDFNIRDTVEDQKLWSSLQYKVKDLFQSVVVGGFFPGCQIKINVFVLMADHSIQAALINAVFVAFLKMGLPMRYTIYAMTESTEIVIKSNSLVFNISKPGVAEPIYGKCTGKQRTTMEQAKQIEDYRQFITSTLNLEISSNFESR